MSIKDVSSFSTNCQRYYSGEPAGVHVEVSAMASAGLDNKEPGHPPGGPAPRPPAGGSCGLWRGRGYSQSTLAHREQRDVLGPTVIGGAVRDDMRPATVSNRRRPRSTCT